MIKLFTLWSWKESLNSDSQQVLQHQLSKQLPLTSTLNIKKTMIYEVGNPGTRLEEAQKCDGG